MDFHEFFQPFLYGACDDVLWDIFFFGVKK